MDTDDIKLSPEQRRALHDALLLIDRAVRNNPADGMPADLYRAMYAIARVAVSLGIVQEAIDALAKG